MSYAHTYIHMYVFRLKRKDFFFMPSIDQKFLLKKREKKMHIYICIREAPNDSRWEKYKWLLMIKFTYLFVEVNVVSNTFLFCHLVPLDYNVHLNSSSVIDYSAFVNYLFTWMWITIQMTKNESTRSLKKNNWSKIINDELNWSM